MPSWKDEAELKRDNPTPRHLDVSFTDVGPYLTNVLNNIFFIEGVKLAQLLID